MNVTTTVVIVASCYALIALVAAWDQGRRRK